jgi:serine/threonine protein kinase
MGVTCSNCGTDNTQDSEFCKKCASPLTQPEEKPIPTATLEVPKEELTTGSTFAGRYQIIEELGRGGMGRVYKATDTKIKEKVALKLIKPEIASEKKTLERFGNELRIARKIVHKNVGRMYDINEEDGTHYITMEYVSGQDLKGLIRQTGQLAIGTSLSIAKQVCDGLSEAHKTGVVHRDLKPSNIMIDREGDVRIMDFGIARSLKEKGITGAGVMIGTPDYMSPEQAEAKEVDHRSDIYSLGIILYEMVTGRVPFEGDTALSIAMKHKGEAPKDPKEYNAQIPDDLSNLILKCLEKDKDSRFQRAGEIQSELENIEKSIPTTDRAIPRKKPLTSKEITVTFGLKRLVIPVLLIVALAIIAVVTWQFLPKKDVVPIEPVKPSIAVLPFEDLSPQKDQEYFCNGLAESLINALSKVKNLRVPAMTSTASFKDEERNIHEIAEKLNVNTVLRGSVQKAENQVRITAQLISVADESLLWSEQYNREFNDLFSIQDEISFAIAEKLKVNLLGKEREDLRKRYTENIEAYNLYLKGRHFWNKRTGDSLEMSIEYFEQATELDSDYALAYAGLADCYIILPFYSGWLPKEAYLKAQSAASKALELDNMLAEAHNSLGALNLWYEWDWNTSAREFKRAIELNTGLAIAHHWYAELLKSIGRVDAAIEEIKIAIEIDPLSLIINRNYGMYLYLEGRYDEAITQFRKTIELDPEFPAAYAGLGYVYLQKGLYEQAVESFKKFDYEQEGIVHAHMALGNKNEALAVLEDLKEKSSHQYVDPYFFAVIYAGLGEIDITFEALERAYQEQSLNLVDYIYVTPLFDSIRSDPRFKSLMRKLNFE